MPAPVARGASAFDYEAEEPMPRLFFTESRKRPLIISVDQPVGPGCPNKRTDVLLVQFMLKVADESPQNTNWWRTKRGRGVKIDGVFGEHTQSVISQVQEQYPDKRYRLARDSRIDPVSNGSYFGARTGVLMTMVVLNVIYMQGAVTDDITTMPHHGWWPKELTQLMQVNYQ
jgi:hypothetical protein